MTALSWKQTASGLIAHGQDWVYLVTHDDRQAVLTRWASGPTNPHTIAFEAAAYAIRSGGVYQEAPEAAAAEIARLQRLAQQYESGIDIESEPYWRHGYVPEGT